MARGARQRRPSAAGGGLVQAILVLLVVAVVTVIALKTFERTPLPQVGPGTGHPARAVIQNVELRVEGLSSEADAAQVEEGLRKVPGVASVTVDTGRGVARVAFSPAQTNPDQLIAAIQRAGYSARR